MTDHAIRLIPAVLLITVVGPFVYINVIKDDPPERLSLDDVTTTTSEASTTTSAGGGIEGTWTVADGGTDDAELEWTIVLGPAA